MDKLLVNNITEITEMVKSGGAFVLAEMPSYIQQMVRWHVALSWAGIGASLLFLVVPVFVLMSLKAKKAQKEKEDVWYESSFEYVGLGAISWIAIMTGIVMAICGVSTLIKITIAPKVWIVDTILSVIR